MNEDPSNVSMYIMIVLGILLSVSEGLALIPSLKSNGILSIIINILKSLLGKQK